MSDLGPNEWNRRAEERSTTIAAMPMVEVVEGWKPGPPLFGAGQVIRVLWTGAPTTATIVSGSSFGDVRLYLPDTDEWVECVLVRDPASEPRP